MTPRAETLQTRGEPVLYQLTLVPSYALTVHKTQAMSIKHVVLGSLEGIFALGQVYVPVSRVTDPENFHLVGVPPKDLVEAVALALRAAGFDPDQVFDRAVGVSNEWRYNPDRPWHERFSPAYIRERQAPPKHKELDEILKPQAAASIVIGRLLRWIGRVDGASQAGLDRPPFCDEDGSYIFPPGGDPDEKWYLTGLSRRKEAEELARRADEDGPPPGEESSAEEEEGATSKRGAGKDEELTDDESSDTNLDASQSFGAAALPIGKEKHQPKVPNAHWNRSKSAESL